MNEKEVWDAITDKTVDFMKHLQEYYGFNSEAIYEILRALSKIYNPDHFGL